MAAKPKNGDDDPNAGAKTIRLVTAVRKSLRPRARPASQLPDELLVAVAAGVDASVSETAAELNLAELAPEELVVSPPPRPDPATEKAPNAQDAPGAINLAVAEEAGFSLADPEDLAALTLPDPTGARHSAANDTTGEGLGTEPRERPDVPGDVLEAATNPSIPDAPAKGDATVTVASRNDANSGATEPPAAMAQNDGPPPDMLWTGAPESFLPEPVDNALGLNADMDVAVPTADPVETGIILTRSQPSDSDLVTAMVAESFNSETPQVISRVSTSDAARLWGISLGAFNTRHDAERSLITVRMAEAQALSSGISRIRQTGGRFEASFAGLTEGEADRACSRLSARGMDCSVDRP